MNRLRLASFYLIAVILFVAAGAAVAAVLTATWQNATTNTDGSAIPATGPGSIASTRFEWGTCGSGGTFGTKLGERVVAGTVTSAPTDDLGPGTYCGRGYHTNTYGVESDPSIVVQKVVPAPKPNPPTNLSF